MESALVSVIIPNYNYAEFLQQAIESVLNQDYPNIEIIVVDDGSVDESCQIVKKYQEKVKLIQIENSGAPVARNFGLINSTGFYIAYLDSDDYWERAKISKQVLRIVESNTDLVYCKMKILDVSSKTYTSSKERREGDFSQEFILHPAQTPFAPSTVLMKRDLVAKVGLWDSAFKSPAEDFDYFRRCARHTNFSIVDEELVIHRNHKQSLTAKSLSRYYEDNRLSLIKLFADEYPKIHFWGRRKSWIRLNVLFAKSFLKSGDIKLTLHCILQCALPINF